LALEIQRRHENSASARKRLEASFKKATAEIDRKRKALEGAEAELKTWQDLWTAAVHPNKPVRRASPLLDQPNRPDFLRTVRTAPGHPGTEDKARRVHHYGRRKGCEW
jgi:hypothetical protein